MKSIECPALGPTRIGWGQALVAILWVGAATASPFQIGAVPQWPDARSEAIDFLANFFIGASLGLWWRRVPGLRVGLVVGVLAAVAEASQAWLFRHPSALDALVIGASAVGVARLARSWRCGISHPAAARVLAGLGALALAAALHWQAGEVRGAGLVGWDADEVAAMRLVLGNERAPDERPLHATLESVAIEGGGGGEWNSVWRRVFAGGEQAGALGDHRRGAAGLRLRGGRFTLPASESRRVAKELSAGQRIRISARLRRAGGVASQGRVLTFSSDVRTRLFTLGIDDGMVQWRVRSAATGRDGMRPQLKTPSARLAPDTWHDLQATFGPERMDIAVDGRITDEICLVLHRAPALLGRGLGIALLVLGLALGFALRRPVVVAGGALLLVTVAFSWVQHLGPTSWIALALLPLGAAAGGCVWRAPARPLGPSLVRPTS